MYNCQVTVQKIRKYDGDLRLERRVYVARLQLPCHRVSSIRLTVTLLDGWSDLMASTLRNTEMLERMSHLSALRRPA